MLLNLSILWLKFLGTLLGKWAPSYTDNLYIYLEIRYFFCSKTANSMFCNSVLKKQNRIIRIQNFWTGLYAKGCLETYFNVTVTVKIDVVSYQVKRKAGNREEWRIILHRKEPSSKTLLLQCALSFKIWCCIRKTKWHITNIIPTWLSPPDSIIT